MLNPLALIQASIRKQQRLLAAQLVLAKKGA